MLRNWSINLFSRDPFTSTALIHHNAATPTFNRTPGTASFGPTGLRTLEQILWQWLFLHLLRFPLFIIVVPFFLTYPLTLVRLFGNQKSHLCGDIASSILILNHIPAEWCEEGILILYLKAASLPFEKFKRFKHNRVLLPKACSLHNT